MTKVNTPNIPPGYQQTKIGVLPVEWEVVTLGEIASKKISYGIVQAGPHIENGQPYIKSSDLNGDLNPKSLQRTSWKIATKYKRSTVHPGDIVFSLRGNIGVSSIVPDNLPEANLTQGTARITSKNNSNEFIIEVLRSQDLINRISSLSKGSTFREISLGDLRKVKIPLPPLPEQQKIAQILSTWDDAIRLQTQLINAKKEQKRGLMQRLLTGEVRLPGFSSAAASGGEGVWESTRMNKILRELKKDKVENAETFELVTVKLYCKGIELTGKSPRNTEKGRPYYFREPGEILVGRQNFHNGGIGRVPDFGKKVVASNAISSFKALETVNTDFLLHAIMNPNFYRKVGHLIGGTGQKEVSRKEFSNLRLKLPSIPEQTAIANILTTADKEITLLETQLTALKEQKRGLMQRLLTGQVRVKVADA